MKRILAAAAALLLICTAAACGEYNDAGLAAVGDKIGQTVSGYAAGESPVDVPDQVESAVFIKESADIVSDIVAVYKSETAEKAAEIESLCRAYLDDRCDPDYINQVSAYDLISAAKLKSAEVFRTENYVVLCISDAATVKNVKNALKEALQG